jgi:hypothetical protein
MATDMDMDMAARLNNKMVSQLAKSRDGKDFAPTCQKESRTEWYVDPQDFHGLGSD